MDKIFSFLKSPVIMIGATILLGVGFLFIIISDKNAKEAAIPRANYEIKFWGKEDSKVIVTEYGDFQCEACLSVEPMIKKLKETYEDKIRFEYKYLNLSGHANSRIAAEAAEAANAQGKFWEFHDLLFERQQKEANLWSLEKMVSYAEELDLDTEKFRKELSEGYYKKAVEVPANEGANKGYNATPTIEINGRKIERPTFETLSNEISLLLSE